jgi:hypothetical protein
VSQHDSLACRLLRRKQEIRAEGGLEFVTFRERVGCIRALDDLEQVHPALAAERNGVFLVDERLDAA